MHNIAIINGKESMGYSGQVPWHALGSELSRADSVAQALTEANLNWLVRKEPVYLGGGEHFYGQNEQGDCTLLLRGKEVKNIKAVVRDIDQQILGTVGSRYKLIQNHEAFAPLQHAIDNHGATIETAGALGLGDRIWMLVKLPTVGEVVPGDSIEPYFLVTNSHTRERSQALTARFTPVRVVCQNTLDAAEQSDRAAISIRHTASAQGRIHEIETLVETTLASHLRSIETYKRMQSVEVSEVDIARYLLTLFPIPADDQLKEMGKLVEEYKPSEQLAREQIMFLVDHGNGSQLAGKTVWGLYNSATEWVDHCSVLRQDGQVKKTGMMSALFGNGANVKRRALDLALSMFVERIGM